MNVFTIQAPASFLSRMNNIANAKVVANELGTSSDSSSSDDGSAYETGEEDSVESGELANSSTEPPLVAC